MRQADQPVAEAIVWCVASDLDGPAITGAEAPDVKPPTELALIQELVAPEQRSPHRFWDNFEYRPISFLGPEEWARRSGHAPKFRAWYRYVPTAVFDDPFVEAARVAMLIDIAGWPALVRAMEPEDESRWIAPNLDLAEGVQSRQGEERKRPVAGVPGDNGGPGQRDDALR